MTDALADIFAAACGIAGWFYLFYSRAASKLVPLESPSQNRARKVLRRACGAALVLLGAAFYVGFNSVDEHQNPGEFLAVWGASFLMLVIVLVLVATDIIFTARMRRPGAPTQGDRR